MRDADFNTKAIHRAGPDIEKKTKKVVLRLRNFRIDVAFVCPWSVLVPVFMCAQKPQPRKISEKLINTRTLCLHYPHSSFRYSILLRVFVRGKFALLFYEYMLQRCVQHTYWNRRDVYSMYKSRWRWRSPLPTKI